MATVLRSAERKAASARNSTSKPQSLKLGRRTEYGNWNCIIIRYHDVSSFGQYVRELDHAVLISADRATASAP